MGVMPEILSRYSCKDFKDTPLAPGQIDALMEAAHLAPSAKNRQAWRFIAVTRPDLRARITEASYGQEHVAKAPCLFACCTTNIDYKMPNGQLSYPIDIGIAAGFIMLQASHLGLGSCAITTFDEDSIRQILTIPYLMKVVVMIAIGEPADQQPARQRLPMSRISSLNSW